MTLVRWTAERAPVLANLLQLYAYDMGEFSDLDLDPVTGRYPVDPVEDWIDRPGRDPWSIAVEGAPAGFALVGVEGEGRFLDDFFVLRRYRRAGVGSGAARAVFATHAGRWGLTVRRPNLPALAFWRRTLPQAVEGPPVWGPDGNERIRFDWTSG